MSRPAARVLALLEILQDRDLVPADELARRLDVDARAVRRYVTALREMDVPVESVRGRYGGYRLARGVRLPPLMLADDEAVAVAVALATGRQREEAGEPDPADRALVKLNRVLPASLRRRVTALTAATSATAGPPSPEPHLVLTLAAAVHARRTVRIEHTRGAREVDPYGLVVHARRWYLVGHDHLRAAVRMYRLDRIGGAAELPGRFTPPEDFDPVAHVLRALTLDAWTHRTEVWLDTDLPTARDHLPATFGDLRACPGGGVLLVSGAENLPGMARVLSGLPWPFTVRSPPELVTALADHVTALTQAVACSRPTP
ncbi:helix-turn-helix transcriptional regulator [Actinomadura decatromicini]|uniref:YafY family transcriptional regulator n=1 Tax=Actinomadura decatromicini TaxID=2604572 RepID=A0A5D3FM40_9ACTN|nr:YafY family protein [Actinomadura decatromicini]TYK49204.1 YafY family transcriptional regulator [Actinomadura decatromicini]